MKKRSAGILAYRIKGKKPEVLLVHPGGPFWKNKDEGAWSIPKGEYDETEDVQTAAIREFGEETGHDISGEKLLPLSSVKQKSGKWVDAFAMQYELNTDTVRSNTFEMEWPPRSGNMQSFPEIDKAEWFGFEEAHKKINPAQAALLAELQTILGRSARS